MAVGVREAAVPACEEAHRRSRRFQSAGPRRSQPKEVYAALLHAFEGFSFTTAGELEGAPGRVIDHIAHTPDMALAGGIGYDVETCLGTCAS